MCLPICADQLLFEPKYLSGQRLVSVCILVNEMVGAEFPGSGAHAAPELKAVVITATKPEASAKIMDILKKYDVAAVPTPEPTFTIYLVRASDKPPDQPHPLPAELTSVIEEMKRSFTYASYSMYDTIVQPPHTSEIESMIPGAQFNGTPYFYTLRRAGCCNVESDGKTVEVPTFIFQVKVPYQSGNEIKQGVSSLNTGLTVREGQKVVLGKVKIDPQNNTDVFLVVTVKLQPGA
jgi:hypothetical protein